MMEESPTIQFAQMLGNFRRELEAESFPSDVAIKLVMVFWEKLSGTFSNQEDEDWDKLLPD